jgi:hypothetical protein
MLKIKINVTFNLGEKDNDLWLLVSNHLDNDVWLQLFNNVWINPFVYNSIRATVKEIFNEEKQRNVLNEK